LAPDRFERNLVLDVLKLLYAVVGLFCKGS